MNSNYELFRLDEAQMRSFAISKVLSVGLLFTLLFVIYSAVSYMSGDELDKPVIMYYSNVDKLWLYSIAVIFFVYLYNLQDRVGNLKNIILQINDLHIRNVMLSKFVQGHLMQRLAHVQILMLVAIGIPIAMHFLSSSFWFSFAISSILGLIARWQINEVSKFVAVNEKESIDKYVQIDSRHLRYNLKHGLPESL